MTQRSPHILFAAGGTGGHVYPAIAIADAVRKLAPEAEIIFAGTRERMEWTAVPKAGYRIYPITVSGLQRRLTLHSFAFPFKLLLGLAQSWRLVHAFKPDVVVGTGGYVSGPVLLAAALRGVPLLIQEQNAYPGLTNRLLAHLATQVHVAFEETKRTLSASKCVLSGNPTRKELIQTTPDEGRAFFEVPVDAKLLFAFGGSLGSEALNEALLVHHQALLQDEAMHLLWQTGTRYYERLRRRLDSHPRLHLLKYVEHMDRAYAACDLALCRAGALTCSELQVTRTPAVLVPSPNVAEDHQTKNAESMARHGAAVLLPEHALQDRLVETVQALLDDETRLQKMTEAAGRMARPDAAHQIARHVLQLADGYRHATDWQPTTHNPQPAQ